MCAWRRCHDMRTRVRTSGPCNPRTTSTTHTVPDFYNLEMRLPFGISPQTSTTPVPETKAKIRSRSVQYQIFLEIIDMDKAPSKFGGKKNENEFDWKLLVQAGTGASAM